MPILVLAARLCPEGVEATLFATLMSVLNGGAYVGSLMGSGLTQAFGVTSDNFDNLFWLVALCNVCTLLPMPFLRLLPDELNSEVAAAAEAEASKSAGGAATGDAAAGGSKSGKAAKEPSPTASAMERGMHARDGSKKG